MYGNSFVIRLILLFNFGIFFLFANVDDENLYPLEMMPRIIKETIDKLGEINSEKVIAEKYGIKYPVIKVTSSKENIIYSIEETLLDRTGARYPKFDEEANKLEAEKRYPTYKKGTFVTAIYESANGGESIAQGVFNGLEGSLALVGSLKIPLPKFNKETQDAFTGNNKVKRESYLKEERDEHNRIRDKGTAGVRKEITEEIYERHSYIKYKNGWWEPIRLLQYHMEKENLDKWDEVYAQVAASLAPVFGYKYQDKEFVYVGTQVKEKDVYFDIDF